jgi:hypothetical protein
MTDTGMHYGSFIPEEFVTTWVRDINEWELLYKSKLFARSHLPYRDIGEANDYDMGTYFQSDDGLAQVIAKGSVPEPFTVRARTQKHEMFCIATGFVLNERDLAKPDGATMKTQDINVAMAKMHGKEDYLAINGDTSLASNFIGIVGAGRANSYGKITAAASSGVNVGNMGAWAGTDANRDPYEDVLNAVTKLEDNATPYAIVGNKEDMHWLHQTDSERNKFSEKISPLFGKSETDFSWMIINPYTPSGYVYVVTKDPQYMEFVASQDITIDDSYPKKEGGNYWIEVKEYVNPCEVHQNEGVVEIQIT